MNPQIKAQWCDALRSAHAIIPAYGETPERKKEMYYMSSMRSGTQFAPDGILTDIFLKDHNLEWEYQQSKWCALGHSSCLPDAVKEWAGLDTFDPVLPSYNKLDLGVDAAGKKIRLTLGEYSIPTMAVLMTGNNAITYSQLADLIEIDL